MSPDYAIDLYNVAPKESYSEVRKSFTILGLSNTVAGIAGANNKITPLALPSGTTTFLTQGYDLGHSVTTAGVFSAAFVCADGLNFCQFRSYLFGAGGGATPKTYDGTSTLITSGWTGTGLTATNLEAPWVYRGRLYFCEAGSRNVWYGAIDQVLGAASPLTRLPLDSWFIKGGSAYAGGSSCPEGSNRDSESVWFCVSTEGEVLVYTGADPGVTDGSWQLYGRYFIPPLTARNSIFYIGGVAHFITNGGIISINDILSNKKDGSWYLSLTKLIDPLIRAQDANPTAGIFPNQCAISPRENLLYIGRSNAPAFVMNMTTGAWSRYKPAPAGAVNLVFLSGFATAGSDMYFLTQAPDGSASIALWKAGQGNLYDQWGSGEAYRSSINWYIQSAYINGGQNSNKKFNKVRPLINQQPSLTIGSYSDFITTLSSQSVVSSLTVNKKFYDINKEAFYLSLYLGGGSNGASTTTLPQYYGSLLSYEQGSNVP
jgi:hypothetical protein